MFGLFKKRGKKKKAARVLADVDGNALVAGDHVVSLRYELGDCQILVPFGLNNRGRHLYNAPQPNRA